MFLITADLRDSPSPSWWEAEYVQYGLTYRTVRRRLTTVMGNHVVRLTDRSYMTRLASRLQEDHETRQSARIESRKLRPTTIVPELRGLAMWLPVPSRRARRCAARPSAVARKRCKQLPRLLLTEEPEARS